MSTYNLEQVREQYLRDLQNMAPAAHVHPGSDNHARATALAALAEGQYQHQEWVLRQAFAHTADPTYLERHCAMYGIKRKPGAAAGGRVSVRGKAGTRLPLGLTVQYESRLYRTLQEAVISSGTTELPCQAVAVGAAYNLPAQTVVRLQSAPAGAEAEATVVQMIGGTDTEGDAALLARLLSRLRRPPAGGNAHDYYRWAMEVPGVEQAFVYPLRRGLGTVDVAVLTAAGLPSPQVVKAVQDYIDERRPVTAKHSLVLSPTAVPVSIRAQVSLLPGYTLEAVKAQIEQALRDYFTKLKPGETVYKSHIEGVITLAAGVRDRVVSTPAGNTEATVTPQLQWLTFGGLELGAL